MPGALHIYGYDERRLRVSLRALTYYRAVGANAQPRRLPDNNSYSVTDAAVDRTGALPAQVDVEVSGPRSRRSKRTLATNYPESGLRLYAARKQANNPLAQNCAQLITGILTPK